MKCMVDRLREIASEYLIVKVLINGFGEITCRIVEVGRDYAEFELLPSLEKPQEVRIMVQLSLVLTVRVSRGELPSDDQDCANLFRPKRLLKQSKVDECELADIPLNYD